MRHQSISSRHAPEPCFEVPPLLSARPERRLTSRALAAATAGNAGRAAFRGNTVRLARGPAEPAIIVAGSAVQMFFGLAPGQLTGPSGSAAAALALALRRLGGEPLPFEAVVATPSAACVLLRAILLPLADEQADAVLSWKEVLGGDAAARLRAELLAAFARPRVTPRRDAFG